jgi:hypothetical protein
MDSGKLLIATKEMSESGIMFWTIRTLRRSRNSVIILRQNPSIGGRTSPLRERLTYKKSAVPAIIMPIPIPLIISYDDAADMDAQSYHLPDASPAEWIGTGGLSVISKKN